MGGESLISERRTIEKDYGLGHKTVVMRQFKDRIRESPANS